MTMEIFAAPIQRWVIVKVGMQEHRKHGMEIVHTKYEIARNNKQEKLCRLEQRIHIWSYSFWIYTRARIHQGLKALNHYKPFRLPSMPVLSCNTPLTCRSSNQLRVEACPGANLSTLRFQCVITLYT